MSSERLDEGRDHDIMPEHEGLGSAKHWYNIPCKELITNPNQQLIVIPGEASIDTACETLITHGISSAPVWDKEQNSFVGMFDYRDVATFVLAGLSKDPNFDDSVPTEVRELVRRARAHEPVSAKLVADISNRNPFYSVIEETPLLQLAELFSRGIHRVTVVDGENLKGIISQSTLVKYLYGNARRFPELQPILSRSLTDLGLGSKHIIAVESGTPVTEALKLMVKKDVSSLAVLDFAGGVVANLSLSDVKWMMKSGKFNLLWESCLRFVSFVDYEQGVIDGKDKLPVFDVLEGSTLAFAVGKIVATRAHRVWVVERVGGPPISVVTLTDVFKVLLPRQSRA
ncbi:hypothetical protein BC832DRAFT_544253 [Gaertneriomyces semiglobifer]|nr:hypothetical protein BC832DRAFT_544253 [Gaertneriomyces semiglobifer]